MFKLFVVKFQYLILPVILFSFAGCGISENSPVVVEKFKLTDITGNEKNVFQYGQEFKMQYSILNDCKQTLNFSFTGYWAKFVILKDDLVTASSTDGLCYAMVVINSKLKPGESIKEEWTAPNTMGREPKIILPAGKYKAIVEHGALFNDYKLNETQPIEFSVVK